MAQHVDATLITRHMKDLLKRSPEVVRECTYDPNRKRDRDRRAYSKGLSARAIAAKAIEKAMEGSVGHLDHVLERTEGKVASDPGSAGALIQFNFNIQGGELGAGQARQVGEVIQGVIAQAVDTKGVNPPQAQHTTLTDGLKMPDQSGS